VNLENKSVLIIDDEEAIRDYLRFVLEEEGCTVLDAENGNEGLKALRSNNIDLVIVDIVMPDRDGFEVISDIKKDFPDIAVIIISGAPSKDLYLNIAQKLGVSETLEKPFKRQQILEAVSEVLPGA